MRSYLFDCQLLSIGERVPFLNATQTETETILLLLCLPVLYRNLVERNMLTYIYTDTVTVENVRAMRRA